MARAFIATASRGGAGTALELGKLRENRGVSLEQIAEETKISMRFLRAIESEQFSELPGGIFNTNYLRQYAAAIGLEESKLLAFYRTRSGDEEANEFPTQPAAGRWGLLRWLTTRV